MKQILIINGSGGVGKDTFVDLLGEFVPVKHDSIVNPTKSLAKQVGWDGKKDERDRKFLAELKSLIDEYKCDYCQVCDFNGEIQIVEDTKDGKLVWECPI